MKLFAFITLSALIGLTGVSAQTPAPAAAPRVTGTVAEVDTKARQITVKTDKGETVVFSVTDRSFLRRMPAGETDAKKALKIELSDLATGDRVVATGQLSADQKMLDARTVLAMSKTDVAEIHQKENEDWQKRGTTGTVTGTDPAAKTINIKIGQREITV